MKATINSKKLFWKEMAETALFRAGNNVSGLGFSQKYDSQIAKQAEGLLKIAAFCMQRYISTL